MRTVTNTILIAGPLESVFDLVTHYYALLAAMASGYTECGRRDRTALSLGRYPTRANADRQPGV